MTHQQILLFVILAASLGLFAWGRWRYDVVAMLALMAAVLCGVVPSDEAFTGFAHPAVITVAAVLILSHSLKNSGLIVLAKRLLQPMIHRGTFHVLALTLLAAVCSAFMNNVGAVALLLPVAVQTAYAAKRPPSRVLMPLSFASLLGGLVTLIGTPPNIIIANFRAEATGEPFAMFDFAPVGLAVMLVGVAYVALLGWRVLPYNRKDSSETTSLFHIEDYITEVKLSEASPYVGRRLVDIETLGQGDVAVVALVRNQDRMLAPSGYLRLRADDVLILEADTAALSRVVKEAALDVLGEAELSAENLRSERVGLVEAVVGPGARLEGRTARSARLHTHHGLNLLGLARQGQPISERLGALRFQAGDVLLLHGEHEAMPEAFARLGLLPLASRNLGLAEPAGSILGPILFGLAILLVVLGVLPPHVAFIAAVIALVLLEKITLRELYDAVNWPVLVLLGAMIPVGLALATTGATEVIVGPILTLGAHLPLWAVLTLLMVVTMLLSDIMNNAATAVLMAPIGISLAEGLGVSVDPFLMAVAIGASSTYLTPIGHQSNLLVMGPGGYRFGDYWRMGLPLDVLILCVAVPLIPVVWPFY